jgi:ribosome-associated toxin RatA of RatAB toxin-antitoxin module
MSTPPATALPRRRRRRLVIPLALLLLVAGSAGVLVLRGTWADATPHNPASLAEGPVAQLYQPPGEHKRIRCAILLPYPREQVWKVVTDYAHYGDFLPYLANVAAERKQEGVWHMTGQAKSALQGYWDFAIDIHEEKTDDRWVAHWDQPSGEVLVNKGGWTVTPAGNSQSLLVLELEAEVHHYPTFFLRNFFLHRLKQVLLAVDRHLRDTAPSSP